MYQSKSGVLLNNTPLTQGLSTSSIQLYCTLVLNLSLEGSGSCQERSNMTQRTKRTTILSLNRLIEPQGIQCGSVVDRNRFLSPSLRTHTCKRVEVLETEYGNGSDKGRLRSSVYPEKGLDPVLVSPSTSSTSLRTKVHIRRTWGNSSSGKSLPQSREHLTVPTTPPHPLTRNVSRKSGPDDLHSDLGTETKVR